MCDECPSAPFFGLFDFQGPRCQKTAVFHKNMKKIVKNRKKHQQSWKMVKNNLKYIPNMIVINNIQQTLRLFFNVTLKE